MRDGFQMDVTIVSWPRGTSSAAGSSTPSLQFHPLGEPQPSTDAHGGDVSPP
jgi:hypothetical protein